MSDVAPIPRICAMLYCGNPKENHVNIASGQSNPLGIYVRNAETLARSLASHGLELTLITNDPDQISRLKDEDAPLKVEHVTFTLDVPADISFHSAHFKLELIRLFGEGRFGPFPALFDIDTVALQPPVPPDFNALWAYDLTPQVLGDKPDPRAFASMEQIAGKPLTSRRWFGGEFLAGNAAAFRALWEEIARIWPNYRAVAGTLYHTGDEMVLSAALNSLIDAGFPVRDAGAAKLVARWWSAPTGNAIPPLSTAASRALLHLPADKVFLAEYTNRSFIPDDFLVAYRAYVADRLRARRLRSGLAYLRGRRFAPQLD